MIQIVTTFAGCAFRKLLSVLSEVRWSLVYMCLSVLIVGRTVTNLIILNFTISVRCLYLTDVVV